MSQIPLVRIHNVDSIKIDSVERPSAGPDDIVLQVAQCGICGSDLSYIKMGGLLGPGVPMALGHELSGTIIELGANVEQLAIGERVVVNPMGNGNLIGNSGSEGGFSPYLLVRGVANDPQCALKLPAELDDELGALIEPLAVAMHGAHQGRTKADDQAVIFGAGPIGLCLLLVLRYLGLNNIVVVDLCDNRLGKASELGGIPFKPNAGKPDTRKLDDFLIDKHGSATLMGMTVPATDLYFEATGVGAVFTQAVNLAKTAARIVVVGVHKAPVQFDLVNVLMRELVITGSQAYTDEFAEVIAMLQSGKVDPTPLITHRYPLSDFDAALATAKNADEAIKVLVDCQG